MLEIVEGAQGPLMWWHNQRNGVSNHRRIYCLRSSLFRRRSKKTSKLRVTGLCDGNSPVTVEFLAQMASKAENVSTWWHHHVLHTVIALLFRYGLTPVDLPIHFRITSLPLVSSFLSTSEATPLITRFMGPIWGPSGAYRTQMGPTLAPWTLLSGDQVWANIYQELWYKQTQDRVIHLSPEWI